MRMLVECGVCCVYYEQNISSMTMLVLVAQSCHLTFEMLSVAFGVSTVSRTQVQLWYKRFKEGRVDINDDACNGCPIMSFDI